MKNGQKKGWMETVGFLGLMVCVSYGVLGFAGARNLEFSVLSVVLPLVAIPVLLLVVLRPDRFSADRWVWSGLVFLAYVAWRAYISPVREYAIHDLVLFSLYGISIFLAIVCLNNSNRLGWFFGVLFSVAIVGCFVSVYQSVGGNNWVWGLKRPEAYAGRASGFFVNPNHWAGYLEMVFFLSLTICLVGCRSILFRVFSGYTAVMAIAGIAMTQSRMAILSVSIVSGIFIGFLFLRRGISRWVPISAAVFLIVLGMSAWFGSPKLRERVSLLLTPDGITIKDYRPEIWRSAFCVWKKEPVFGAGPNQFRSEFRSCRSEWLMRNPVRAHCDYLNVAADLGVVGATLLGLPLICLIFGGAKDQFLNRETVQKKRGSPGDTAIWKMASFFALGTLLVHSIADFHFFVPANGIVASVLAGVILIVPDSKKKTREGASTGKGWSGVGRWLLFVLIMVVAMNSLISGGYRLGAAYWLHSARKSVTYSSAVAAYQKSLSWVSDDPLVLYELGETFRQQSFLGEDDYEATAKSAMEQFGRLMEVSPKDPYPLLRMGMCMDWLGRSDEAGEYFEKAYQLDPNNKSVVAMQGWHAFQREEYESARDWLVRARKMPHTPDPLVVSYLPLVERKLREAANRRRAENQSGAR